MIWRAMTNVAGFTVSNLQIVLKYGEIQHHNDSPMAEIFPIPRSSQCRGAAGNHGFQCPADGSSCQISHPNTHLPASGSASAIPSRTSASIRRLLTPAVWYLKA